MNQINSDIPIDEPFLYISWKMQTQGLFNVGWAIRSVITYCIEENIGRNIIISNLIPLAKKHSPSSDTNIRDLRRYFDFPNHIETDNFKPVKIFFDRNNKCYNNILNIKELCFMWTARNPTNFLNTFSENAKFSPKFWICRELSKHEFIQAATISKNLVYCGWQGFCDSAVRLKYNYTLQQKAKTVVDSIRSKHTKFHVLHLRRGDMLRNVPRDCYYSHVKEYSDPDYVVRRLRETFEVGSSVYLMTNGNSRYVSALKSKIGSDFHLFTQTSFPELNQIGKADNYELFVIELCIAELSDKILSNRSWDNIFEHTNVIDLGPIK